MQLQVGEAVEVVSAQPTHAIVPHPAGELLLLTIEEITDLIRGLRMKDQAVTAKDDECNKRITDKASKSPAQSVAELPPDDVLLEIASFLDSKALALLSGACKQLHALISSRDHQRLWALHLEADFGVRASDLNPRPYDLRALYGVLVATRGDLYRGSMLRARAQRVMATTVGAHVFTTALASTGTAQRMAPSQPSAPPVPGAGQGWFGWGWDRLSGMFPGARV